MPAPKDIKKIGNPKEPGNPQIPKKFRGKLAESLKKTPPGTKPDSLPARIYIDKKADAKAIIKTMDDANARAKAKFKSDLDLGKTQEDGAKSNLTRITVPISL